MKAISIIVSIILAVALLFGIGYAVVVGEANKVDCVVVSCERTDDYVNQAAKVLSTVNFVNGKYTSAMAYGSMAKPQARYTLVVEFEGVQYEMTTSTQYEVGSVVRLPNPANN